MVLRKICIVHYKNFNPSRLKNKKKPKSYVFDLTEQLTALVGQNGSGKTTVLNALELFCNSIKNGSECCLPISDLKLYDFSDDGLPISLQGVFIVYYRNTEETKSLELNVKLVKMTEPCDCKNMGHITTDAKPRHYFQLKNDREAYFCISVEGPDIQEKSPQQHHIIGRCCQNDRFNLLTTDYGIFEGLFPHVVCFYSKDGMNTNVKNLVNQNPVLQQSKEKINEEFGRIFPLLRLTWSIRWHPIERIARYLSKTKKDALLSAISKKGEPVIKRSAYEIGSKQSKSFDDITSCSEGELQCFLLIVTILLAEPHSIILIDEPDAHIFPTAQRLLIDFFYRKMEELHKSNLFCQMVITTHSPDTMQAIKLKHIRQIFLDPNTTTPMAIKSLAGTSDLLNTMIDVGASILSHGEIIRFGVHRKLLYLENRSDFEFVRKLIHRGKPELSHLPMTIMQKGGRTQPSEIRHLIIELKQFLPEEAILDIFVLVDSDLRSKTDLNQEKTDYDAIGKEQGGEKNSYKNVRIHYHCWGAREWENWLLFNEEFIYNTLGNDQWSHLHAIKELREKINETYRQLHSVSDLPDEFNTASVTGRVLQLPTSNKEFREWFIEELYYYWKELFQKELTLANMVGCVPPSKKELEEAARKEGDRILREARMTDEIMKNLEHLHLLIPLQKCAGYQSDKQKKKSRQKKNDDSTTTEEQCRLEWLNDRALSVLKDPKDLLNDQLRKELIKWIDAKPFFHYLIHGNSSKSKNDDLDGIWKRAFSSDTPGEDGRYGRYFDSLIPNDPLKWPKDFEVFLEKFQVFLCPKIETDIQVTDVP
jgi:predicted ATPase